MPHKVMIEVQVDANSCRQAYAMLRGVVRAIERVGHYVDMTAEPVSADEAPEVSIGGTLHTCFRCGGPKPYASLDYCDACAAQV